MVYYNPVSDIYCSAKENGNNNIYYVENNSASGTTEGCLKWNVLSKNEDGTVNLILDHNIVSGVKWASKEDYVKAGGDGDAYDASTYTDGNGNTNVIGLNDKGPITAVSQLDIATKSWHPNLTRDDIYRVNNTSYYEIITNYTINYNGMKARLPEAGEIASAVGHPTWNENTSSSIDRFYFDSKTQTQTVGYGYEKTTSDYAWLFNNLAEDDTKTCLNYGCTISKANSSGDRAYWTSTFVISKSSGYAWGIRYSGNLNSSTVIDSNYGIRPVITLNK